MYLKVYMCLHLVALITYYILPKFVGIEKRSISITSNNITTTTTTTSFNNKTTTLHHNSYDNANNTKYNNDVCDKTTAAATTTNTTTTNTITTNTLNSSNNLMNDNNKQNNKTNRYHHRTNNNYNDNNGLNTETFTKKNFANKTKNIEDFFDKTVTGIVDFKDDLMKINSLNHLYPTTALSDGGHGNIDNNHTQQLTTTTVDQFLKKEIDALQQATMIPAVLSNGHAK